MEKQEFLDLLDRYQNGEATEEEIRLLLNYYNSFQLSAGWNEEEMGSSAAIEENILASLQAAVEKEKLPATISITRRSWPRVAAACILLVSAAMFIWPGLPEKKRSISRHERELQTTPAANENNVLLVMGDGRKIVLDNHRDGVVTTEGNTVIRKQGNSLSWEYNSNAQTKYFEAAGNHQIVVPRGWQYRVVLPDGSRVWLNTSSTLSFPSSFVNSTRDVELTGEAYFEVARDASKPFRVNALRDRSQKEGTLVEVLGTHFNVNAYNDEQHTRTTLLEGSVKVSRPAAPGADGTRLLVPGEEAIVTSGASQASITVRPADTDVALAWKSGLFNFRNADIHTIMREIARWYNVRIVYESQIPERSFSGKFNRSLTLSDVLEILEQSSIHFRIEGNTVVVTS